MSFTLTAKKRTPNHPDQTRAEGLIPAIVYGAGSEPMSVSIDAARFNTLYAAAGESTLIDFSIEGAGGATKVLIQDIQYDPVKRKVIHADLRQINMNKEMEATVPLSFIGESIAVKGLGGTLITSHDEVEVKCLPKNLVSHIEVDLSRLATFDDALYIKDIIVPASIVILDDPETLLAKVLAPLTEDQIKAMEEEGPKSVEDVEVAGKKKEEEGTGEGAEDNKNKKEEKKKE